MVQRTGRLQDRSRSCASTVPSPSPQIAVAELQSKHGKAAQRRYVLLSLWMARKGAGVLPGKAIVDAARRLRVS